MNVPHLTSPQAIFLLKNLRDILTKFNPNRVPIFGFTMVFPIALIFKIVIAQVLFLLLN